VRVGPMPIFAAEKLIRTLEKSGHEGEILPSGEEFKPDTEITAHPRIESQANLCYVEFDEAHLPVVRADLVRLALLVEHDQVSTGDELDGTDWMCLECGHTAPAAGLCPTHRTPLITFEDYAIAKRSTSNTIPSWLIMAIAAGIAAAFWIFSK